LPVTDPTDGTSVVAPAGGATIRAIATGMVIGTLLTPCNVYSGLKIGWSFNMSITAGLLAFAFWRFAQDLAQARPWHLQENVINRPRRLRLPRSFRAGWSRRSRP
jgi:uncharacterized oligopeptide transporter (OPT) family protein